MPQEASNFLHITHLNKQVASGDSQITILSDANLTVSQGETIAVLGASGSGKTTLLSLIAGLDLPTSGDIYFQNQCITMLDEEERALLRKKNIGFIFQSFQLLPSLTALENVMLPLEIQYIKHERCITEAAKWLNEVGLGGRLHHYPAQLSGGEQQRVAIARAFVSNPKLILADEMTGNLDTQTGKLVADILFSLNERYNTTCILVTHDTDLAKRCSKRFQLNAGILQLC